MNQPPPGWGPQQQGPSYGQQGYPSQGYGQQPRPPRRGISPWVIILCVVFGIPVLGFAGCFVCTGIAAVSAVGRVTAAASSTPAVPVSTALAEETHQVQNLKAQGELPDKVKQVGVYLENAREVTAQKNWIAADDNYGKALALLQEMDSLPGTVKSHVPADFDLQKKEAEVLGLRSGIAGLVAQAIDERDRAESKREAKANMLTESCLELSTKFGTSSRLSDLQKDQAWPSYTGRQFEWQPLITDVRAGTFGGYVVQAKCAPQSQSFVFDIQISYDSGAKDYVSQLDKGSVYSMKGTLTQTSTLLGLGADGVAP